METVYLKIQSALKSREFWAFASVGIINTLVDFAILNLLTSAFGWNRIAANIVSTTIALTISFALNSRFVFTESSRNKVFQIASFIGVTLFGLYVLQSLILWLLGSGWTTPISIIADQLGIDRELAYTNIGKLVASGVTMIWNFVMYKKVVFKK